MEYPVFRFKNKEKECRYGGRDGADTSGTREAQYEPTRNPKQPALSLSVCYAADWIEDSGATHECAANAWIPSRPSGLAPPPLGVSAAAACWPSPARYPPGPFPISALFSAPVVSGPPALAGLLRADSVCASFRVRVCWLCVCLLRRACMRSCLVCLPAYLFCTCVRAC